MARKQFWLTFCGLLLGVLLAAGCQTPEKKAHDTSIGRPATRTLRIGYQKGGAPHVLRLRGDLDRRLAKEDVKVEWVNFPAGPQLLEAVGVNSIDLGATGDSPAIFAQAAGIPIVYVANTPPGDPDSRAILVPKDSPIKTLNDLRGKRIAVQKGSGTHNFLVQALEKVGIPYNQVKAVYLAPPDARAAFDAGSVDAWAIWDPFLAVAQETTGARVLANGAGIVTAGGFYLSSREFARKNPDLIRAALEEVDKMAIWLSQHPRESAELLAPSISVDAATLEKTQSRMRKGDKYVGFRPIDDSVMRDLQVVADNFQRIGLLPKRIEVRGGLLTPEEYAALTPQTSGPAITKVSAVSPPAGEKRSPRVQP